MQQCISEASRKGREFWLVRKPKGQLLVDTDEVRPEMLRKYSNLPLWKVSFGSHLSSPVYFGYTELLLCPPISFLC